MNESADASTSKTVAGIKTDDLGPAALASLGSVGLALYFYYVRGDKQRGQFVGLWPGTILGLATYLQLEQVKQTLDEHADDD
ncbi:hypothetical protein FK85_16690 [Halorubrum saccharovorum]|uniref:Uncharacterized protein n=1 Tax=Halorubrum saccharovorum TaxID=2248 RepID=A0A081EWT3_9EURY|nr:hypothetical protein [Halorubrum saccharovorum]KDS91871.1 hypothetical protein FK85_16690 [Halorubrum saccharovorum]